MKKTILRKITSQLASNLNGFASKDDLLFVIPVSNILRGFCFYGTSAGPHLFYMHLFVQPLFVPKEYVTLTLGQRLGGVDELWDSTSPDLIPELRKVIVKEGLPVLSQIQSISDFLAAATETFCGNGNPIVEEMVAYAYSYEGNTPKAEEYFDKYLRLVDTNVAAQREMFFRAQSLMRALRSNPAEAKRLLEGWESQTIGSLGLEMYR